MLKTKIKRDCFRDLGVEEYEIVETLDTHTCEICGELDGKHLPMSQYEVGTTAPPFHPRCRGCTAPYFDDMDDWGAERAARDENGNYIKVPEDMTYEQWKAMQDAQYGEGSVDKARKMEYNKKADKEQYRKYVSRLGSDAPKSFSEFQKLKYSGSDDWDMVKLDYRRRNMLIEHPEFALPNTDKRSADDRKFTGYLFNPDNADGWAKGTLFTARLGYDKENYVDLKRDILRRATMYPAMSKGVLKKQGTEYGERFEQKVIMYGKTGKPTNVVVAWIKEGPETRMTSAYIKEID